MNSLDFDILKEGSPETEPERQLYFIEKLKELVSLRREHGLSSNYLVEVMGCQMSARDGEKLSGILEEAGYSKTEDANDADIILFSTCTVRENANQKLYGRVGRLKHQYERRPGMVIGITGCMMQEEDEVSWIRKHYPYVRLIFGTHNVYKIAELLLETLLKDRATVEILKDTDLIVEKLPSKRKYPYKASVNISFGCDNFCTYCIVPYVRGREKSRKREEILEECRKLVNENVKEITLLGQNVNSYGNDFGEKNSFPDLLREVSALPGIRVRFMTSNPKDLSDELIEAIRENENIARHIHLPLQSGSTRILKRMNRHYTKEEYLSLVEKIYDRIPGVSITTDIIVGFPGETEEDFQETLDVVAKAGFDSAFTFIYSRRTGTPAARWDLPPENEVKDRFQRLLQAVQKKSAERLDLNVGKTCTVLCEKDEGESDEGYLTGRMSNNILVHFKGDKSLIGSFVNVRITENRGFYYYGERDLIGRQ